MINFDTDNFNFNIDDCTDTWSEGSGMGNRDPLVELYDFSAIDEFLDEDDALLNLFVQENMSLHTCDPLFIDEFCPIPPCKECYNKRRPAAAKVMEMGDCLREMVFPTRRKVQDVFPRDLVLTHMTRPWNDTAFFHLIQGHLFNPIIMSDIKPGNFFFDIVLKLKAHQDKCLQQMNDFFWPTIYDGLFMAENDPTSQREAYHLGVMRILALRIAYKRLHALVNHFKSVYTMRQRTENLSAIDALIAAHMDARELLYIPFNTNFKECHKRYKHNPFFSFIHEF